VRKVLENLEGDNDTGRISQNPETLWCKIVNEQLRSHSYVETVRGKQLVIKVDSSVYLQELRMMQKQLEEKIRSASGGRYCFLTFIV